MGLEIRSLRSRLNLDSEELSSLPPRDAYRLSDMSLAFQPITDLRPSRANL